jgi:hypothetical protein
MIPAKKGHLTEQSVNDCNAKALTSLRKKCLANNALSVYLTISLQLKIKTK